MYGKSSKRSGAYRTPKSVHKGIMYRCHHKQLEITLRA